MRLQDEMLRAYVTDCFANGTKPNPVNGFIFWNVKQARLTQELDLEDLDKPVDATVMEKINICQAFLVETIIILKDKGYTEEDLLGLKKECEELV